jgi:hypothetical protein
MYELKVKLLLNESENCVYACVYPLSHRGQRFLGTDRYRINCQILELALTRITQVFNLKKLYWEEAI